MAVAGLIHLQVPITVVRATIYGYSVYEDEINAHV